MSVGPVSLTEPPTNEDEMEKAIAAWKTKQPAEFAPLAPLDAH